MPDVTAIRNAWSGLGFAAKASTLTVIALLATSAWGYMVYMAWAMDNMHLVDMWMPPRGDMRAWLAYDFFMLFSMWLIMMVAMMLPSAIPLALLFARVQQQPPREEPDCRTDLSPGHRLRRCLGGVFHRHYAGAMATAPGRFARPDDE